MINYKEVEKPLTNIERHCETQQESQLFQFLPSLPKPKSIEPLSKEDHDTLKFSLGYIFGSGLEIVNMGIEMLKDLLVSNFVSVYSSMEFQTQKQQISKRIVTLVGKEQVAFQTIQLFVVILNNTSELDESFIQNGIGQLSSNLVLYMNDNIENINQKFLYNILNVLCLLVARNQQFRNELFNYHVYDALPNIYRYEGISTKIQKMIAKFFHNTTINAESLIPSLSTIILNVIPIFLNTENQQIITVGLEILSRLSLVTNDVIHIIEDESVLSNLCKSLSSVENNQDNLDFIRNILKYLSKFSSLGDDIIAKLNQCFCLQTIASSNIIGLNDQKIFSYVFHLLSNWLVHCNSFCLDDAFQFLKLFDFNFILSYFDFTLKRQALHVLRLCTCCFSPCQLEQIFSDSLFSIIISQVIDSDDNSILYESCFIINSLITKIINPNILKYIQNSLQNKEFFEKLSEYQITADDFHTNQMVKNIISFITKGDN